MKRITPKYLGFETEVGGHLISGAAADKQVAARLLREAHDQLFGPPAIGRKDGAECGRITGFGGSHPFRVYIDHGHVELASPLSESALGLLQLQERAVDILRQCKLKAEKECGSIRVHLNTTSRFGHAWAYHLNVLVGRHTFDHWRDRDWEPLLEQWVPFLVTSPILFGTGKIGAENGRRAAKYQLSQRADFITDIHHYCTVDRKALINERHEPLADPARFARFHIAAGFDFNLCPFAAWLKFGVTQVLLALIESRVPLPSLRMRKPLAVLKHVSRDPELRESFVLADRTRATAIGVQEQLATAADRAIRQGTINGDVVPDAESIVEHWLQTLDHLRSGMPVLRRRIDWVAKLRCLTELRRLRGLGWRDPRLVQADLRFAELGGWFETLRRASQIDEVKDFFPKGRGPAEVHTTQRDAARTQILDRFRASVVKVDWHYVWVKTAIAGTQPRLFEIRLDDPLDAGSVLQCLGRSASIQSLIANLPESCCRPIDVEPVCIVLVDLDSEETRDETRKQEQAVVPRTGAGTGKNRSDT